MTDLTSLIPEARKIIDAARHAKAKIATAESCTGGLIAASLTEIAGSAAVVDRGFITYSNEAKIEMLGVPQALIEQKGAVSKEVAVAMAQCALLRSNAEIALSVTGIAGPGGATPEKPVGLVHFAIATPHRETTATHRIFADSGRQAVRLAAVAYGLELISNAIVSIAKTEIRGV